MVSSPPLASITSAPACPVIESALSVPINVVDILFDPAIVKLTVAESEVFDSPFNCVKLSSTA